MKLVSVCCTATALLLSAMPTAASEIHTSGNSTYAMADLGGAEVTAVNRGQSLAIACGNIGAPNADVRVVMALDPVQGEEPTGYEAVLLTGQTVEGHAVRVRVPDVPDLRNHTVTLRVYITDGNGTTSCNAGHLRIV